MEYADYDYYKNTYLGNSIEEDDFLRLALRSSQYIDYITRGKAEAQADKPAVKMACCAIAEQYQMIEAAKTLANKSLSAENNGSAEVQSESVGSWSRSYRSGGESAKAAAEASNAAQTQLYSTALQFLANAGLLYRGGGRCC